MRCIHVVPGISHEASGPSYSVPRLCEALLDRGIDLELFVSDKRPIKEYNFPCSWHSPVLPFRSRLGRSPELYRALKARLAQLDILHNHSLWMMANVYPGWLKKSRSFHLITSPRGTLSPWALRRSSLAKRFFWICGQRLVLMRATCIHATSEAEYFDIRRFGLKQPVAIIPNGYDLPKLIDGTLKKKERRRLLYLGRIHPVKALDRLIDAWTSLGIETNGWELQIVGPGEDRYVADLKKRIISSRSKNINFIGAEFGEAKSKVYFQSDAYVLASHSENFAMTVAEALAHGIPSIVSKGAPWSGLFENRCGWWVDNEVASLASSISTLIKTESSTLKEMGLRGRDWIERDFGWPAIAERMERVYSWVTSGGEPPIDLVFE